MSVILAVISDIHIGSTVALSPPSIQLDDGGEIRPFGGNSGRALRWLWQNWEDAWKLADKLCDQYKAPLWVVHNGDAVDGDHHGIYQTWTRNMEEQIGIAEEVLRPVRDRAERFFMTRGTDAHVGKSAWSEELLAQMLDATPNKAGGTSSWWHLLMECDGVRFDIAHHGRLSRLPWTRPNTCSRVAAQVVMRYATPNRIKRMPHVVVRSHMHLFAESGTNYPVRVVSTPAWQLVTEFGNRLDPGELADIGIVFFVCDQGEHQMIVKRYTVEPNQYWTP